MLRGLALKGLAYRRVVLLHGPNQSADTAGVVSRYARSLKEDLGLKVEPFPRVDLIQLTKPFDSAVVQYVEENLLQDLDLVNESQLSDWQVIYGSGTVPMNVATVSLWLSRGLRSAVWDYNEVSHRLTDAHGNYFSLGESSHVPLESLVRVRTGSTAQIASQPRGGKGARRADQNAIARLIGEMATTSESGMSADTLRANRYSGWLLERCVYQIVEKLVPDATRIMKNVEIKFPTENLSREVDIVVETKKGRLFLISCGSGLGQTAATYVRRDLRDKCNEIRQLAGNYFGNEARTLTVFMTRLKKGHQPKECPIVSGARFDAQVFNHRAVKHWLVSGHELFGTNPVEVQESFRDPKSIQKRLPGLRAWLNS